MTAMKKRNHRPPARRSGPTSWPNAVKRHAATRESVADVARIWTRKTIGQSR
jgi:hypothetical protein